MSLRPATSDDIDALVNIYVDTSLQDDDTIYIYPRWQHDHVALANHGRKFIQESLTKDGIVFHLIEAPSDSNTAPYKLKPIALAVWKLPGSASQPDDNRSEKPEDHHPDAEPTRLKAYLGAEERLQREVFAKYGENRLHLRLILCLPEYQRRGYGTMLMAWGTEKAKKEGLGVTVFASLAGEALYRRVGMVRICDILAEVEGEGKRNFGVAYEFDGTGGGGGK